jgi:ribonuclease HI
MDKEELETRLNVIDEMIKGYLTGRNPVLFETFKFLHKLRGVATGVDTTLVNLHPDATEFAPKLDHIIVSCDASIKQNPGGPSSVGVVIQLPGEKSLELAQGSPATSNNQAEYDAVYFGLTTLMNTRNNPGCEIEVRSDSQLVIKQLNGEMKCNDEKLQKRRDLILELTKSLPVPVRFVWRPRNSTPQLELANYLAQDLLDVPRH